MCLKALCCKPGKKSILKKLNYDKLVVERLDYLPPKFDGDVIFELPSVAPTTSATQAKSMAGMDKRYDGHVWTKTLTSNISNDMGLTFRRSSCVGHLRCDNPECDYLNRKHQATLVNEAGFEGCMPSPFSVGGPPPRGSTLVCKICKEPPTCVAACEASIYYVHGKPHMTRACIHLGCHGHPVKVGDYRDTKNQLNDYIKQQVEKTPSATRSAIVLEATKDLLGELLLRLEDAPTKTLTLEELEPVFDRCKDVSSPNLRNNVITFKYLKRFGWMESITMLRGLSTWAFVQKNMFPGQGDEEDKVFVFKMSEVGPASGVDLVKRMQPGGDLQDAWVMFDHAKRVHPWTTMACHVYDSTYCRVMTIACCDMQSEDNTAQQVMWKNLNAVMARNSVPNVQFKGFMADSAQANWNAVRIVYGNGNKEDPMPNRTRTCYFHWTQSLEKHTKTYILSSFQDQHRTLCKQYKDARSMAEADTRYFAIRAWWTSSGAATVDGYSHLQLWLAFWHFRYRQWGGFMVLVSARTNVVALVCF